MRIRGKSAILDAGGDNKSPPLPFLEMEDGEAEALIRLGVAERVGEDDEQVVEPVAEPVVEPVVEPAVSEGGNDGQTAAVEPEPVAGDPPADVVEPDASDDLADAIELLGEDDFVKTGARAGRPKVKPLEDVLGRDLTVEQVDAAWAAKQAE